MEHVAFLMRVKQGQEEEYLRRHENVWPEELAAMKRAGIHNMRIFKSGLDLFVYMDVEDYARATRILDDDPDSRRWEEHMEPLLEGAAGEGYDPDEAYPDGLPLVFEWDAN